MSLSKLIRICVYAVSIFLCSSTFADNTKDIDPFKQIGQIIQSDTLIKAIKSGRSIILDECTINGIFALKNDTINGKLRITNSSFSDSINLSDTYFKNHITFYNTVFNKDVYFSRAKFDSTVTIAKTTFKNRLGFKKAVFERGIGLYYDSICGSVNLNGAVFSDTSIFKGLTFGHDVELTGASFLSKFVFSYNKWIKNVSFAMADLTGGGGFTKNHFYANVYFGRANLESVGFYGDNLKSGSFDGTNLKNVIFQPDSVPDPKEIAYAYNLEDMKYIQHPRALYKLRDMFRMQGYREQERQITYAIKKSENALRWKEFVTDSIWAGYKSFRDFDNSSQKNPIIGRFINLIEFVFNCIVFDWTFGYGMNYGRPLLLILLIWMLFAISYFGWICGFGKGNIHIIYQRSNGTINELPLKLWVNFGISSHNKRGVKSIHNYKRHLILFRYSMLFSLMSCFNIGFRGVNFGRLIRLMLSRDIDLKPIQRARTASAIQAIFCFCLIILFFLGYFGRPFD